jgi:hypothetical protein
MGKSFIQGGKVRKPSQFEKSQNIIQTFVMIAGILFFIWVALRLITGT